MNLYCIQCSRDGKSWPYNYDIVAKPSQQDANKVAAKITRIIRERSFSVISRAVPIQIPEPESESK